MQVSGVVSDDDGESGRGILEKLALTPLRPTRHAVKRMATAGSAIKELYYVATSESVVAGGGSVAA